MVSATASTFEPRAFRTTEGPNFVLRPGDTSGFVPTWRNNSYWSFILSGTGAVSYQPPGITASLLNPSTSYGVIHWNGVRSAQPPYLLLVTGATSHGVDNDVWLAENLRGRHIAPLFPETNENLFASKTWVIHVGDSFADVPATNPFYPFIENIFHNGVTAGCDPTSFCPLVAINRAQMAVFVLRAREGASYTPPPAVGIFDDLPASDPFAPWVEELFHRGVVSGCSSSGGQSYCPKAAVLREQMAVFLLRTLLGSGYEAPECTGIFRDVPCGSQFANWIEDLYNRGITGGCDSSPLMYCPTNPVLRQQMAPLLVQTFGLQLYGL
jgi:hypothetical protein